MKNILRIGMLLCMFLLGSVGWAMAQEEIKNDPPQPFTKQEITQTDLYAALAESSRPAIGIFASGHPVTIKKTDDKVVLTTTVDNGTPVEYELTNPERTIVFGGSYDNSAQLESTSVTIESGTVWSIVGGSYGASAGKGKVGTTTVNLNGGTVNGYVVGGGALYSFTSTANINSPENSPVKVGKWVIGCIESGKTEGEFSNTSSPCKVSELNWSIEGGTFKYIGLGGGNGAFAFSQTVRGAINNSTINGGLFGCGPNGQSSSVKVTIEGCTFSKANYPIEIAAVNRGKIIADLSLHFRDCTFNGSESDYYVYAGATYDWTDGGKQSSAQHNVTGSVVWTFTQCEKVPFALGLSDGLDDNLSVSGIPVQVAPFVYNSTASGITKSFTVPAGKTWSFNNGLKYAADKEVSLTNYGTLNVAVSDTEQLEAAVKAGADKVTMAINKYELSSQLVINKAMTIVGSVYNNGSPGTTIKANTTVPWPTKTNSKGETVTDNTKANLISIVAGSEANVSLKHIRVQESMAAGINVQTAAKVTLENVACENNTTAGLLVHAPVEATNFHTGRNKWGGVNIDKGNNAADTYDYKPSFQFDARSTFDENANQIWSELADKKANDIVTLPEGNTTWRAIKGKSDDGKKDMWFWTNQKLTQETVGGITYVYANGNPVTVAAAGETGKTTITSDGQVLTFDDSTDKVYLFGGSKDASVENTRITMTSGKLTSIYGGGNGSSNNANVTSATGNSIAIINITGGEVEQIFGGGRSKATTQQVDLSISGENTKIYRIYAGGWSNSATRAETWDAAETRTGIVNINISHGATIMNAFGCGGGFGYTYTGTSVVRIFDAVLGDFKGTYSNGYADEIDAELYGCTFKPFNWKGTKTAYYELATTNRGVVNKGTFTFTNCTFAETSADVNTSQPMKLYIGVVEGWGDSDTNGDPIPAVKGSVSYTFVNCEKTPQVVIGEGMDGANVTLTGAPALLRKYHRGDGITENHGAKEKDSFTINADKTWTFNNGLTFATEQAQQANLTNSGTLIVKGVTAADLATLNGTANEIGTTATATEVATQLASMGLKEKTTVIYASDANVYATQKAAEAEKGKGKAVAYLAKESESAENYTLHFLTVTPTVEQNKIKATDIEVGQTLAASILSGGSASYTADETTIAVAGTFSWKDPNTTVTTTDGSYTAVFTPTELDKYGTVEVQVTVKAIQYYTVTIGKSANGKVTITEGANAANKYESGAVLKLQAEADPHYVFDAWGNGITDGTYTVSADKELTATFKPKTFGVTITGSMTVLNGGIEISNNTQVQEGTVLTVIATPSENEVLASLTCNGNPIINNQVTVNGALSLKAAYNTKPADTYLVTVAADTKNGKVQLYDTNGNLLEAGKAYAQNTVIKIVAVPDLGYEAGELKINNAVSTSNSMTVGTEAITISQAFNKKKFAVTLPTMETDHATVTLTGAADFAHVEYGTELTVSSTSLDGDYKFLGLVANGQEISLGSSFVITSNVTITAVTQKLPDVKFMGGTQTYTYTGSRIDYVAHTIPAGLAGVTLTYKLGETEVAPINVGEYKVYASRAGDQVYAALSDQEIGTLKITKAPAQAAIPTPDQVDNENGSDTGKPYQWKSNPAADADFGTAILKNVDDNHYSPEYHIPASTSKASSLPTFNLSSLRSTGHELTLNTNSKGSIELYNGETKLTNSGALYAGQTITVKAIPNAGYSSLVTWYLNGNPLNSGTPSATETITMPNANVEIKAVFATKPKAPISTLSQTVEGSYNGVAFGGATIPAITSSVDNWRLFFMIGGVSVSEPTEAGEYKIIAKRDEDLAYSATEIEIGTLNIKAVNASVSDVVGSDIFVGSLLSESIPTGVANVDGTFEWTEPTKAMTTVGDNQSVGYKFTPNSSNYKPVTGNATVNVKALATGLTTRQLTLSVTGAEHGTVKMTLNGTEVPSGTAISKDQTLVVTATANSGYSATVKINGESKTQLTIGKTGDVSVTVTFTENSTPVTPGGGGGTVDPDPVIPTVSNPVVAERTATTAAVTWEKVSGATSYKLFLYAKKTDSTPLKIYEFDKDGKLKATAISFTLTGLEEGKAYYVETAAYNASGTLLVKKSVELSATPTGIEAISEGSQLYTVKGAIVVAPAEPLQVAIYSVTGQTLFNDEVSYLTQVPAQAGIYVVVIQKGKERITEKVFVK